MLRNMLLMICGFGLTTITVAQTKPEVIIYKWKEGNITYYAKQPPRGVGAVTRLDEQGLVISEDYDDNALYEAVRPKQPSRETTSEASTQNQTQQGDLPEGTITREQRCTNAQADLAVLTNTPADKEITMEDSSGNLIPISADERQKRLEDTQQLVKRLCND